MSGADRSRLVSAAVLAGGLGLVVAGFLAAQGAGDNSPGRPAAVELVIPGADGLVLRQSEVGVDLAPGYTGELAIDGVAIPTQEVVAPEGPNPQPVDPILVTRFDPGLNTLLYLPRDGAPIEQFEPGEHRVALRYWKIADGPEAANTFSWTFEVS